MGTLKAVLARAGIPARVRSLNLRWLEYLGRTDPELLSADQYLVIANEMFAIGLGEWIFAVPPFRQLSDKSDRQYFELLRKRDSSGAIVARATRLRAHVPAFLEECARSLLAEAPRIVGFTTLFSQTVPSLALAAVLKAKDPSLSIVFGGAHCQGDMGAALHRNFPYVDVVVRGEAEHVLPPLVRELLAGAPITAQPGLCYREGEKPVAVPLAPDSVSMSEVPMPDYDDYFEELAEAGLESLLRPELRLMFESARGCWWGERAHCTFCGLNGLSMRFRSKSPDRVLDEVKTLAERHRCLDFHAVDNIIDMEYFPTLLPLLRDARLDTRIFYETKSNLKKPQVRLLRDAGVTSIQAGIESLSTPVLKLMKKGVTGLQNIRLLNWCAELGVELCWNFLYGFPGEPPEEYERMAALVPSLTHLNPAHLNPLRLDRFSPYHNRPFEHGIEIIGPRLYYSHVFPEGMELNDLAYFFRHDYLDGRDPNAYVAPMRPALAAWHEAYQKSRGGLRYRRGPNFLRITDRRTNLGLADYTLDEDEARIYLACDAGATPAAVQRKLAARGLRAPDPDAITRFLDGMVARRLAYVEDGRYLSLAIADRPDEADELTVADGDEAPPGLVSLRAPARTRA
jgi:ribosomal peptide maturation radical SAM protein 1